MFEGLHQPGKVNQINLNQLPDDKILDLSKLEEIADNIKSAFKMEHKYHIGKKTL